MQSFYSHGDLVANGSGADCSRVEDGISDSAAGILASATSRTPPLALDLASGPAATSAASASLGWASSYSSATASAIARSPSAPAAPRVGSRSSAARGVSFYGEGVWTRGRAVPPIFLCASGQRSERAVELDRRLRAAESVDDFAVFLSRAISGFDVGNTVVALSCGAKFVDERTGAGALKAYPVWDSLVSQVLQCAGALEPRGLSMVAYAAAKLAWRDERVLRALAVAGIQRATDFGVTDIAKICWGFAKFNFVDEAPSDFWPSMEAEVKRKAALGKTTDLSMIAWSFATAGAGDNAMYASVSSAIQPKVAELDAQSLSNIAWGFATTGVFDRKLLALLIVRALQVIPSFTEFDVSSLCWSLARLDFVDYELFGNLASHTVAGGLVRRFTAQMSSHMAWAFALAKFPHAPLFDALGEFVARHAGVFETEHIASCAWAFAVAGIGVPQVFESLADVARGSKLWKFRQSELSAFCWAFAKVRWDDAELVCGIVQVSRERLLEFDSASLVNLLSSLVSLRRWADVETWGHIQGWLDQAARLFLSGAVSFGISEFGAVVRAFCRAGHVSDALALFGRLRATVQTEEGERLDIDAKVGSVSISSSMRPNSTPSPPSLPMVAYTALLFAAERAADAAGAVRLWSQLADEIGEPTLGTACHNCAVMAFLRVGQVKEASLHVRQMASLGFLDPVARQLARRAGICAVELADLVATSAAVTMTAQSLYSDRVSRPPHKAATRLALLLQTVLRRARPGDTISVLAALEVGAGDAEFTEIVPVGGVALFDDLIARQEPALVLELGTGAGYVAALLGLLMRPHRGRVVTVEEDPVSAAVARSIFELADQGGVVRSIVGFSDDVLEKDLNKLWCPAALGDDQSGRLGPNTKVDVLVLHGQRQHVTALEQSDVACALSPSCVLISDGVLRPGAPQLLRNVCTQRRRGLESELVAVSQTPSGDAEHADDWVAIVAFSGSLTKADQDEEKQVDDSVSLADWASLAADSALTSESPSVRHGDDFAKSDQLASKLLSAAKRSGIAPTRVVPRVSIVALRLSSVEQEGISEEQGVQCIESARLPSPVAISEDADCSEEHSETANICGEVIERAANESRAHDRSMEEWLTAADPGGELITYLPAAQRKFDSVAKILDTYMNEPLHDGCQRRPTLDPQLFVDLGIESAEHQRLLRVWVEDQCGLTHMKKNKVNTIPQELPTSIPVESAPAAVARLREEIGGVSRICILGGTDFRGADTEELVVAVARALVSGLGGSWAAFITSGLPGVQKVFAEHCGDGSQVFNLVSHLATSGFRQGKDICVGDNIEQRREIIGLLGDVYITFEGGPGVAQEARAAFSRGAFVVPVVRTGGASAGAFDFPVGALQVPRFVERSRWEMLRDEHVPVADAAAVVAAIVADVVVWGRRVTDASVASSDISAAFDVAASTTRVAKSEHSVPAADISAFKTWLLTVDKTGGLLVYCDALEEHYDTPAQVVRTYAIPSPSTSRVARAAALAKGSGDSVCGGDNSTGRGQAIDTQFFKDICITDEQHQALFERWFSQVGDCTDSPSSDLIPTGSLPSPEAPPINKEMRALGVLANGVDHVDDVGEKEHEQVEEKEQEEEGEEGEEEQTQEQEKGEDKKEENEMEKEKQSKEDTAGQGEDGQEDEKEDEKEKEKEQAKAKEEVNEDEKEERVAEVAAEEKQGEQQVHEEEVEDREEQQAIAVELIGTAVEEAVAEDDATSLAGLQVKEEIPHGARVVQLVGTVVEGEDAVDEGKRNTAAEEEQATIGDCIVEKLGKEQDENGEDRQEPEAGDHDTEARQGERQLMKANMQTHEIQVDAALIDEHGKGGEEQQKEAGVMKEEEKDRLIEKATWIESAAIENKETQQGETRTKREKKSDHENDELDSSVEKHGTDTEENENHRTGCDKIDLGHTQHEHVQSLKQSIGCGTRPIGVGDVSGGDVDAFTEATCVASPSAADAIAESDIHVEVSPAIDADTATPRSSKGLDNLRDAQTQDGHIDGAVVGGDMENLAAIHARSLDSHGDEARYHISVAENEAIAFPVTGTTAGIDDVSDVPVLAGKVVASFVDVGGTCACATNSVEDVGNSSNVVDAVAVFGGSSDDDRGVVKQTLSKAVSGPVPSASVSSRSQPVRTDTSRCFGWLC